MSLIEGLTAVAVIFVIGYIILAQVIKKNPHVAEQIKSIFSPGLIKKIQIPTKDDELIKEQIWRERISRM